MGAKMGHFIFIHFFFFFSFSFSHFFYTHFLYSFLVVLSDSCCIFSQFISIHFSLLFSPSLPPSTPESFLQKKKIHFTIFFFQYSILFLFHFLLICFWLSNCFSSVSTMFHSEMGPVQPRYQSLR